MQGQNTRKKSVASDIKKLGKKIKSIDMFGEGVGFSIGDGKATHQSYFGSLLTLVVIVITATYTFKRYSVMSGYEDTVFQTWKKLEPATEDSPLRQEESNFNLMLTLTLYSPDGSYEVVDKFDGYFEINF